MSSIVSRLLGCGDLPDRSSASSFACTRHAMRVCRALVHMLDIPLRCVSTGIAEALLPAVACYDSETALLYILLSTSAISSFRSTGSDLDPIACRRKL